MKGSIPDSGEPSLRQILVALYTLPSDPAQCITLADALADSSTWSNFGYQFPQKAMLGSRPTTGKPEKCPGMEGH